MAAPIVTQLVVDASGSTTGTDQYVADMARLKQAYADGGGAATSFESIQRKWVQSLASADPVIRAQINLQQALNRQMVINADAVKLGIITQQAAEQQLERVRQKYLGYMNAASDAQHASGGFAESLSQVQQIAATLGLAFGVSQIEQWGEKVFRSTADLVDQAKQVGVSTDALQAYRAAMTESGASSEDADALVKKLSRTLGEAEVGSLQARTEFNRLGIDWRTLAASSNPVQAAVSAVNAAILAIPDPAQRAAEQIKFFGKAGQEVGAAMETLAMSSDDIISMYYKQGRVLSGDVALQAKVASDAITKASQQLEVEAAPHIVFFADRLVEVIQDLTTLATGNWNFDTLERKLQALVDTAGKLNSLNPVGSINNLAAGYGRSMGEADRDRYGLNAPGISSNLPASLGVGDHALDDGDAFKRMIEGIAPPVHLLNDALNDFIAKQQQAGQIAGLTTAEAARTTAHYEAAQAYLKGMGQELRAQNLTLDEANAIYNNNLSVEQRRAVDTAVTAKVEGDAAKKAQLAADRLKETFTGYLASLQQAADVSGKSAVDRENEAAVIKGAVISEREHGVLAKDVSKTYAEAVGYLHESGAALVTQRLDLGRIATVQRDINQQIADARALLGLTSDQREIEIQYQGLVAKYGKAAGDAALAQLITQQGINRELAAQIRAYQFLDSYRDDKDTIAAIRAKAGYGAQGNLAVSQTGLGQAASTLDQSFGSQIFGPGAELAHRSALAGVDNTATANRNTAQGTFDVSAKTIKDRQDLQDRLTSIDQAAALQRQQISLQESQARLGFASDFFGNLASLTQSSNATIAGIGKAAAIIQAEIDGVLAVQKALASYAPPWNYIMAASVGIATAANVAKIAGFEQGGWTGYGAPNQIAGVTHGQEFVVKAGAAAANRPALEAMNAGRNWAPTPANANARPVNVIVNAPPGVQVRRRREGDDEIIDLIDSRVEAGVNQHGPKMMERELANTDSRGARALERHTTARLKR